MDELIKAWRVEANTRPLSLRDRIRVDVAIAALTGKGSERALEMFVIINQMRGLNASKWQDREVEEALAKAIGDDDHGFFDAAVRDAKVPDNPAWNVDTTVLVGTWPEVIQSRVDTIEEIGLDDMCSSDEDSTVYSEGE